MAITARELPLGLASNGEVINVASIPQRSPFRYPGGKTWLIPYVRRWLRALPEVCGTLLEPFAGGAIVGLTAAAEGLAERVTLVELDEDVASVWQTILSDDHVWLCDRIVGLELTHGIVDEITAAKARSTKHRALATIVENRVNRGGILAPGAGRVKNGENGKGLLSRWYPETLSRRIRAIAELRSRINFVHADGLQIMEQHAGDPRVAHFVDPPYTVAGRRLYRHSVIEHPRLFAIAQSAVGELLMTYDDSREIVHLALEHELQVLWVPMKTTHHLQKLELLIGHDLNWATEEEIPCGPFALAAPQIPSD